MFKLELAITIFITIKNYDPKLLYCCFTEIIFRNKSPTKRLKSALTVPDFVNNATIPRIWSQLEQIDLACYSCVMSSFICKDCVVVFFFFY